MQETASRRRTIETFSPSWFASVMGTGILAVTAQYYASMIPWLSVVSTVLFYFNAALFVVLLVPWVLRWILHPASAAADFNHPVISNFYPTISAGLMVLAMDFVIIGGYSGVGGVLWGIGAVATVLFSVYHPFTMFAGEHVSMDHVTPGMFIPPVALLLIPLGGGMFLEHVSSSLGSVLLVLMIFGFGAGFFIYLALFAIAMYRFILHRRLPGTLATTVWINLGPIGAAGVALINMANHLGFIAVPEPLIFSAFVLWGFGMWWFFMAIIMTLHYVSKLDLPFGLSWWAFTFPLGAMVACSHAVAGALSLPIVDWIGLAMFWVLVSLWTLTVVLTVLNLVRPASRKAA